MYKSKHIILSIITAVLMFPGLLKLQAADNTTVVENLVAIAYDSHAELRWDAVSSASVYKVYVSYDDGTTYKSAGETSEKYFMHFVESEGRNSLVKYKVTAVVENSESDAVEVSANIKDFSDEELLDMMQQYCFRYFWEGAHQASAMSRERSSGSVVASGATGMGLMAMIVAYEREYKSREEIKDRIIKILNFLKDCDRYHGAWSHWYNGDTKKTRPFSAKDDGGDLVETSFVAQALIALKNYFKDSDAKSETIRTLSDKLWSEIDWNWYRNGDQKKLIWHWSPNYGFGMNMAVSGWNEGLITYLMAASSPSHSITKDVYVEGWARKGKMVNKRTFYGYDISLMPDWGGPLFWLHYTHLGIDPRNLKDKYADYWKEHVNTVKIHHAYASDNPLNFKNYSDKCWGLTASDDPDKGYQSHQPVGSDNGTITPTAALASMPYAPEESIKALKYFYRERGAELFGVYGPYDAFNDSKDWVKKDYIGIDQGPIVVMIENYRSALLWNTVMADSDVQNGLKKLGFGEDVQTSSVKPEFRTKIKAYPNPATDKITIETPDITKDSDIEVSLISVDGKVILKKRYDSSNEQIIVECSDIQKGIYVLNMNCGGEQFSKRIQLK